MQRMEQSFEQRSLLHLKPIAVATQLLCVVACLTGLVLVNQHLAFSPLLYAWMVAAAVGVYVSYTSTHLLVLWLGGTLVLFTSSACVGTVAYQWGEATFWFLPIGLTMSLPVAAIYHRPYQFVTTGALVWATLVYVMQPQFDRSLDVLLIVLIVLAGLTAGVLVCTAFLRIRHAVFKLQQRLQTMAYMDALTGLPNRRAFMERLAQAFTGEAAGQTLYFLMLDIDDFKKVNDSHGHDVGDVVLAEVGQLLRVQGAGHNVARLGGEEFAVAAYLPSHEAAQLLARNIVQAVETTSVRGLRLSLSIGVAVHLDGESIADLMRRADLALYRAKQAGKNRFVVAAEMAD